MLPNIVNGLRAEGHFAQEIARNPQAQQVVGRQVRDVRNEVTHATPCESLKRGDADMHFVQGRRALVVDMGHSSKHVQSRSVLKASRYQQTDQCEHIALKHTCEAVMSMK